MFEFHSDDERYFDMQAENCREFVIPFVESYFPLRQGMRVLEIGCAQGGVLKPFLDRGCVCVGVELHDERLEAGRRRLADYIASGQLTLIAKDIYDVDPETELGGRFDLVVFKDVIEHIFDQRRLVERVKALLAPGGEVFFGFPPWQMPFGGHQQVCRSRFLSRLPYFHLLPMPLYRGVLQLFGENPTEFVEIKQTGISIERFERIVRRTGYEVVGRRHYFINPIYRYKFNLRAREQARVVSAIPWVRNFVTTCVYYLIRVR